MDIVRKCTLHEKYQVSNSGHCRGKILLHQDELKTNEKRRKLAAFVFTDIRF